VTTLGGCIYTYIDVGLEEGLRPPFVSALQKVGPKGTPLKITAANLRGGYQPINPAINAAKAMTAVAIAIRVRNCRFEPNSDAMKHNRTMPKQSMRIRATIGL
jgi:hypothetical protein